RGGGLCYCRRRFCVCVGR
nr:protegrin, PG-3=leukocyte antimicrobial peptide [swine, blood, Peptide Partial, 18 aa] [Sus scrofa]AAB28192.1 PNP 2=porcine neutrophil peptide 2 [swine, blood leukocytes, Peptide Partial, 18 aa] [Sus scrofa]2MZ6_A Chain A, Protegrin-3 [Sus scrofa]2MZ6_B Chain B, Protegrin-3 [Sus scrofa]